MIFVSCTAISVKWTRIERYCCRLIVIIVLKPQPIITRKVNKLLFAVPIRPTIISRYLMISTHFPLLMVCLQAPFLSVPTNRNQLSRKQFAKKSNNNSRLLRLLYISLILVLDFVCNGYCCCAFTQSCPIVITSNCFTHSNFTEKNICFIFFSLSVICVCLLFAWLINRVEHTKNDGLLMHMNLSTTILHKPKTIYSEQFLIYYVRRLRDGIL